MDHFPSGAPTKAAAQAIGDPRERNVWQKKYYKDLLNVVRAETYEWGKSNVDDGGLGLSRTEACDFAAEWLRGTMAETTGGAVDDTLKDMKRNDAHAFGRYYLCSGLNQWHTKHFPPYHTAARAALIWKWRHRAAVRGNERMRDAEMADLTHVRQNVARGDKMARETLKLYERLQSEDKLTR
jgi:hypothetical protein